MIITDYNNTSRLDGDDIEGLVSAFMSNLNALERLHNNTVLKVESVELTVTAKTSLVTKKIGLDDAFWLSYAITGKI